MLVTRPINEAIKTKDILTNLGFQVYIEPLLEVRCLNFDLGILDQDFDLVIFTSSNAVSAVVNKIKKSIPILTVGNYTMEVLKDFGFNNIKSLEGEVKKMISHIKQHLKRGLKILYVRGKDISIDIKSALSDHSSVIEVVVYCTLEKSNFDSKLLSLILQKKISGVLLYSSKTAKIFYTIVSKLDLLGYMNGVVVYTLSDKILREVDGIVWKKTVVAMEPNQSSLIFSIVDDNFSR